MYNKMFSTIAIFSAILVSVSCTNQHHSIDAAVQSTHTMRTMEVKSEHTKDHEAPVVDINSNQLPLTVRFNTHSSNINVVQKHLGHPAKVHRAEHTDEPDELVHHVNKPIIQRVHEIVHPYRIITQEIRPARERIETVVARDNGKFRGSSRGGNSNAGFSRNNVQDFQGVQGNRNGASVFTGNELSYSEDQNSIYNRNEQAYQVPAKTRSYSSNDDVQFVQQGGNSVVASAPGGEQVFVQEQTRGLNRNEQTYAHPSTGKISNGYNGNDQIYAESKISGHKVRAPSNRMSRSGGYNGLVQAYVQQRRRPYRRA